MRKLIILLFSFTLMVTAVATTSAQTAPDAVNIGVSVSCGSLDVTLDSDYGRDIIAQVYAGTSRPTEWDLVNAIGDFTSAGAYGSASKTYFFVIQPGDTRIYYSVRVYDDLSNSLVAKRDGDADCDGENPPPTQTTATTTTVAPAAQTASFLAACDLTGGITVQPIAGVPFTITNTQITQGTAMAMANNQNITITSVSGITAFGTPVNAVQLVAGDGYSLTIPASSCLQNVTVQPVTTVVSSASTQAARISCDNVPTTAVNTHVVSPGENLFRIGLRYGVGFRTLASYNGIPDPTLIFVGQCIGIPAA